MYKNPSLNDIETSKRSGHAHRGEPRDNRRGSDNRVVTSRAEILVKEPSDISYAEKYFTKNVSIIGGSQRTSQIPTVNTQINEPKKFPSKRSAFSEPHNLDNKYDSDFTPLSGYGTTSESHKNDNLRSTSRNEVKHPSTPFTNLDEEVDAFPQHIINDPSPPQEASFKPSKGNLIPKSSSSKKPATDKSSNMLQFNMDNIVRQIRDDIIKRSKKIIDKTNNMSVEERVALGYSPEDIRDDLEKRLADLMIVGERSGLNKHTLCVYELECHFHIKIALVHLEGPSESIDKAVQLYRMGQYSESLPMLKHQLEKTNCYMHELIAGCEFNLGRIENAGFHFQQAISNMQSRPLTERTIKTEKQQSNLLASAKNAKAKAGESLKNKQYSDAQNFYTMACDLYSAVDIRQEGIDGMVLSMGGMNDVIQALMKLDPIDGGSREARDALRKILDMHEKFNDVINNCDVDIYFKDHCQALCLNIVGFAFECTGRYASAVTRYRDAQEAYSHIGDDRQKVLRMRDCIVKARHAVRSLTKQMGGVHPDQDVPIQVRQAMGTVLQMHSDFMNMSQEANIDSTLRAENQAESLNSVGIGYYELRMFSAAEDKLRQGIDLLRNAFGEDCRHITMAQLTYNMGLLKQDVGELTKAKEYFQEARLQYNRLEDAQIRNEGIRKAEEALEEIE